MNQEQPTNDLPATGAKQLKPSSVGVWTPSPKRGFWAKLPLPNQLLFAASFGCLGVGALVLVGPALVEGAQSAVFPYTSAGKRQTCLSNLESLSQALALYAQDNDGHLPTIEETTSSKTRVTWVTLLQPYVARGSSSSAVWSCPLSSTDSGSVISSYALNPVLAGEHLPQSGDAAKVLLLGDRGAKDDLSLLPPLPGWSGVPSPSFDGRATNAGDTNLDFRHEGEAAGVFADGHAGTLSPSGAAPLALWGGGAAIKAGLRHLEAKNAASGTLFKHLQDGDVAGAAQLLKGQSKQLDGVASDVTALWKLNWQEDAGASGTAALASTDLEEMGWHLARAQEENGQSAARAALDAETMRRCEEERKRVEAASWNTQTSSTGMRLDVPTGWTWSEENKDRYHTASARSPLPSLWVSIEKGDRTSSSPAIPVDWRAAEKRLQSRYGSGYKRLRMEGTTLLGRPAGLWEYELEKPGSPRLRKRYIGTADGWTSYVLSVTAPASDFDQWKSDFDRITGSLSMA